MKHSALRLGFALAFVCLAVWTGFSDSFVLNPVSRASLVALFGYIASIIVLSRGNDA